MHACTRSQKLQRQGAAAEPWEAKSSLRTCTSYDSLISSRVQEGNGPGNDDNDVEDDDDDDDDKEEYEKRLEIELVCWMKERTAYKNIKLVFLDDFVRFVCLIAISNDQRMKGLKLITRGLVDLVDNAFTKPIRK
ncbi:hypothetical protein M0804_011862 [Polistes exclamans]|nr:hypothetical protein M0804_011862 [Polistes exclamans]